MLVTKKLEYSYDGRTTIAFPDIACGKGEHWLILGQSGCGKTTLLHLLGGLLTPRQGEIVIADTSLSKLSAAALDRFRGQHIGVVFQKPHFVKALTVEENLSLAQNLAGLPKDPERIHALLQRLNVGHKARSKPDRLSQGEQQRVAIARAIINKPAVILADEPTSALDDVHAQEVADLLEEQAAAVNASLLIVTHDGRLKSRFPHQIHLHPPASEK